MVQRQDSIDRFLETAISAFPEVDPEVEAAVDRILKIDKTIDRLTERTVSRFGLNTGEFRLLVKLRETPGHRMAAGHLAKRHNLSTGAMTNRLDRLEEAGFALRERDPGDRRSVLVSMTEAGSEVLGRAIAAQASVERDMIGVLSAKEQRQLNVLLRRIMLGIEDTEGPRPD